MARNKNPEETINLILDVAFRLFMEKGYEYTSIQDIIDQLGGLSKGAIYHHFKSKEDILVAVTDRMTSESNQMLATIRDDPNRNGKEKLKAIFKASIYRPVQEDIFTIAPNLNHNSKLILMIIQDIMNEVVPHYILPIINQGVADGSIQTEYPKQLAELIIFVGNLWTNPMLFHHTKEEYYCKLIVFSQMLRGLNLDIIDEEIISRLQELSMIYQNNQ